MVDTQTEILFDVRNHIGHIVLNRPAALNALSYTMIQELAPRLHAWAVEPEIHALLIRGAGDKAFCAGGDIRALYDSFQAGLTGHHVFFIEEYKLDYFIHRYPKPYIALMDGVVMGGGMGISQGAACRVVTERTRLAMPEVAIGLFPDVGASYFLSRLPGALGLYLGLTGVQIRAADILYCGLADCFVAAEHLPRFEATLGEWSDSADRRADLDEVLRSCATRTLPDPPLARLRSAIDLHFAQDSMAAIVASLKSEGRAEYVQWAEQILATIAKRSPTMMCVTHEQLRRGRTMSLADCFRMELGMVHECFRQGDFLEGIRALIVDKDNQPHWNPLALEDVSGESVARFFAPRWTAQEHPLRELNSQPDA
jgi:enoyl-CoA hydratase/carnithine racemase